MRRFFSFGFFGLLLLCACGDSAAGVPDADAPDADVPDAFAPAAHPAAPAITSAGGPVLANPKLVVVTFGDDPLASGLETFAQSLGASSYWSATTSEYGVGAAQYGGAVHLAAPPATTLTQDQLESWLASQLDGTHPEWPAFDASAIYSIVMPVGAGVAVDGAPPCKGSPAYHYEIDSGSKKIVYAAINRCDPLFGLSGIDYVTAGLSHEWIEASSDPFYLTAPAYDGPAPKYNDWNFVTGGEVADMCTLTNGVYFKPNDLPFTVQRSWSNAAAAAGHNPCVPATNDPYFAAAPVLSATLYAKYMGSPFTCEGAHVAVGSSIDVPVDLFSDAPTDGPFTLSASALFGASLAFSWDQASGENGDVRTLTITRKADSSTLTGADFFEITAMQNGRAAVWIGAVGN